MFQQKFVIYKSLFLKFLRFFFLSEVSGREGFCSQSKKGISTEIVKTEGKFPYLLNNLVTFRKSQKDGFHPILRKQILRNTLKFFRGEREWGTSIGLKYLPDIINGVIHSSIFIFFSANFSFCFITHFFFDKQLNFFGQALCCLS